MRLKSGIALWVVAAALLVLLPPLASALGGAFYIDLVRRIMIFAIAAISLNLILGYGGLVSFGHAAYLGVGGYAVAIFAFYGVNDGLLQWSVAIGASALVALAIGAVSIRTSGLYFIMITLAFTQMLYYLGISIEEYGGDDGIRLKTRSVLPLVDLNDPLQFYYLVLALMLASAYLVHRIVNSRFGMALRAARSNEARALAIGFSPYRYRLTAFVIAGAMCGLAGALLVNQVNFLTPEYMHWTRSGDIMFMVILGGMGTSSGPLLGSFALLLLEDVLSNWHTPRWIGEHWQVILGPLLVLAVIFFRRGLAGLFEKRRD
jgi:branched-chain amino acid transport system permease protein